MLAEGVHVVGPGILVPHVNLSIGIKEQKEGKEKEKVDIIGGFCLERGGCLCLTDVTVHSVRACDVPHHSLERMLHCLTLHEIDAPDHAAKCTRASPTSPVLPLYHQRRPNL